LRQCVKRAAISGQRTVRVNDNALLQSDKFRRHLPTLGPRFGDRPLILVHQGQGDNREQLKNVFSNLPRITAAQIDIGVLAGDFQLEGLVGRGVLRKLSA
jgi:hypothetical protein